MSERLDWPGYSRWTWIVAIVLVGVLALLWFAGRGPDGAAACCGDAGAPVASPATADTKEPGAFALRSQGGRIVLEGVVPDAVARQGVLEAAASAYGAGNVVDRLTMDPAKRLSVCAERAAGLMAALKRSLSIGVACDASQVTLSGTAISEADKAARERWAHEFFGAGLPVIDRIDVVVPPPPVAKAADVRCGDRIAAAVTFATGSAEIDTEGKALIDAIVPCLADGEYEISGHSDNTGTPEINNPLSKARADAVRTYLAGKGVPGDRLVAVGYGADNPIADNATEEGRARNRRIEFNKR